MKERHALASTHDRTSRASRRLWLSWCIAPLLAINNSTASAALASEDPSVIEQRAWQFTTDLYRNAALQSLLREANTIAHQLQLQEKLPIEEADLSEVYICPPGLSDSAGWFGRISTRSYHYSADQANKLCYVEREHADSAPLGQKYLDSLKERYLLPWRELNTNAARSLAAEWLAAAQVDLKALERDSTLEVRAWSQGQTFVPLYTVLWKQPNAQLNQSSHGDELETTAAVQLVLAEKRLLLMHVSDPRYILREPLGVANREQLLQSTDDATMRQMWSTTPAYKTAAEAVLLSEVNRACSQLNLMDQLPITPAKLTAVKMATPYITDHLQQFGSVRTSNYVFSAFSGNKLSYVSRNFSSLPEGRYLASIKSRYTFPKSQIKSESAYQLAKRWLASVSVDVEALERDYKASVSAWDLGDRFVALYTVRWIKGEEPDEICAATVELIEPEKALKSLAVDKPEYIKRPALAVANRDRLLRQ